MDDLGVGAAFRHVRRRRGWRQTDLAARAGVSAATIGRIERGHIATLALDTMRRVAAALEIRLDLRARWRAGDLDRLLNAAHSELHELVARHFADQLPAWVLAPEVSFSIFGERGVIDILAWHPGRRALLVIELKTDIADVNELVGTLGRKRRLAAQVARERGWDPVVVSTCLIVTESRTNRRRIEQHRAMLRAAFPDDGNAVRRWLSDPSGPISGMSGWRVNSPAGAGRPTGTRRVRVAARGRPAVAPDRLAKSPSSER